MPTPLDLMLERVVDLTPDSVRKMWSKHWLSPGERLFLAPQVRNNKLCTLIGIHKEVEVYVAQEALELLESWGRTLDHLVTLARPKMCT
mgnify:CR=1 FL=1